MDIRCAPHGRQLCFALEGDLPHRQGSALTEMMEQWRIVDVTKEFTEGVSSRDDLFRLHGCCIGLGSGWIEDAGGKKLLWLPPNWRVRYWWEVTFHGKFLALVGRHHPVPVIIEFQPQLLPHSIHRTPHPHVGSMTLPSYHDYFPFSGLAVLIPYR